MLSNRTTLTLCAGLLAATGCVHDTKRTSTQADAADARAMPAATAQNTNDPVPEEPQGATARGSDASGCELAVYFDTDSARLDRSSRDRLDTVAECMKRREVDHATIVGQTDPSGSEQHNQALGLERAKAVAEYLRNRGVPEDQIRVRSKGETASAEAVELWPTERRAGLEVD